MAVVSAASLKASMATAETALDTLIAAPTKANHDAAVAALDTVIADATDSRTIYVTDAGGRLPHFVTDALVSARALRRELVSIAGHHASATEPVGPAAAYRSIKRTHLSHGAAWPTDRPPTVD